MKMLTYDTETGDAVVVCDGCGYPIALVREHRQYVTCLTYPAGWRGFYGRGSSWDFCTSEKCTMMHEQFTMRRKDGQA